MTFWSSEGDADFFFFFTVNIFVYSAAGAMQLPELFLEELFHKDAA